MERLYSELTDTPYKLVVVKYLINNMFHTCVWFHGNSHCFERCLCVVSPLKAKQIISTRTSAVVFAASHVIILAGNYVVVARWRVVFDPLTGQSLDQYYPSTLYQQKVSLVAVFQGLIFLSSCLGFFFFFFFWFFFFFFLFVCLFVCFLFCFVLFVLLLLLLFFVFVFLLRIWGVCVHVHHRCQTPNTSQVARPKLLAEVPLTSV